MTRFGTTRSEGFYNNNNFVFISDWLNDNFSNMVTVEEKMHIFIAVSAITSVIGCSASLLALLVINRMKLTGHILLIATMTWYQLLYDAAFFFNNVYLGYWWITAASMCQIIGGIAGGAVSMFIAYVSFHVIYFRKSLDIFSIYPYVLVVSNLPAAANLIVYMIGAIPQNADKMLVTIAILDMYYNIRLFLIVVNFGLSGAAIYLVRRMASRSGTEKSPAEQAITTLVRRMILYPIAQAISRSGYAYYEEVYGTNVREYHGDDREFGAVLFLTIITPTLSVANLAIFLTMQPHAYNEFMGLIFCKKSFFRASEEEEEEVCIRNDNIGANANVLGGDDINDGVKSDAYSTGSHSFSNTAMLTRGTAGVGAHSTLQRHLLAAHDGAYSHSRATLGSRAIQLFFGRPSEFDMRDDEELMIAANALDADDKEAKNNSRQLRSVLDYGESVGSFTPPGALEEHRKLLEESETKSRADNNNTICSNSRREDGKPKIDDGKLEPHPGDVEEAAQQSGYSDYSDHDAFEERTATFIDGSAQPGDTLSGTRSPMPTVSDSEFWKSQQSASSLARIGTLGECDEEGEGLGEEEEEEGEDSRMYWGEVAESVTVGDSEIPAMDLLEAVEGEENGSDYSDD